jgi:hypothetical protein
MLKLRALCCSALLLCSPTGCFDPGEGVEPPLSRIYFPVGMAVSPGQSRLYVANSDFDLQFNGGSLQALDLERLRALVPKACSADSDCTSEQRCDDEPSDENAGVPSHWCVAAAGAQAGKPCGAVGEKSDATDVLIPGRCAFVDLKKPPDGGAAILLGAVGIGAFATDVLYRSRPNGPGGRLFIPVRGDATLHYVDVIDDSDVGSVPFELECGQRENGGDCDDRHRRGDDPDEENTRGLRLLQEPFGIDGTANGDAMVLTHQTEGAASLFVNDAESWGDGVSSFGVGPKLEFAVGGLPQRAIGVAALPEPAVVAETGLFYQPGFLVTFRDASEVRLIRYFDDAASQPPRPFIQPSGVANITVNSLGFDSRGIALDASQRTGCEASCPSAAGTARSDCLNQCAGVPLRVFVANRTPSSLLIGHTRPNQSATSSDDLPQFFDTLALPFGPSRVVVGNVIDVDGMLKPRVFVVCFDSRKVGVYDPDARRIEKWIETGRGPHAFAVDTQLDAGGGHALAYVGHFTDSFVGVIDLDQRNRTFGSMVMVLGRPSPPRASK